MQKQSFVTSILLLAGCSGALPPVKPPSFDVAAAADGAITEFDLNKDGAIAKDEACQGMLDVWERYDHDDDGTATVDELKTRFKGWTGGDTGMMNLRAEVKYRGHPLDGATIVMTPYAFLGENVLPAEGVTDSYGYAFMAVPKDKLPKSQQLNFGMQVGLYKVSITHPDRKLAAGYNEETTLSVDLSPSEGNTGVRFYLK